MWLDRLETSFKMNLCDCFIVTKNGNGRYLRVNLKKLQEFFRAGKPTTGNKTEIERFVNWLFQGKTDLIF